MLIPLTAGFNHEHLFYASVCDGRATWQFLIAVINITRMYHEGDHALLDVTQVESFHKKMVTVRTKSGENLSQDSMTCQIPDDLLKFQTHRKVRLELSRK